MSFFWEYIQNHYARNLPSIKTVLTLIIALERWLATLNRHIKKFFLHKKIEFDTNYTHKLYAQIIFRKYLHLHLNTSIFFIK